MATRSKVSSEYDFLYGVNPAFEVVSAGRRKVERLFFDQKAMGRPALKRLISQIERLGIPFENVEKDSLFELTGTRHHQGVVVQCSEYPYVSLDEVLSSPRLLLLDNIEDPQNLGAILRSAEVFGFQSVLLPLRGTPDIYPSVIKASAGATEHLHIARENSANQYVRKAIEEGFHVVALDAKGKTELTEAASLNLEKMLLVIGGEDKSVGQFILNQAHYVVRLDQRGKTNSLNASVAAGIAMFVFSRG
ncbi:MAG: RNA methyltransferase [Planctomycetota bacterium]|nr:RNA methyltransferase [Planctomycetota bacterium]MDA1141939.1 RNA methyltransferase [Planctomycetota bacterium]